MAKAPPDSDPFIAFSKAGTFVCRLFQFLGALPLVYAFLSSELNHFLSMKSFRLTVLFLATHFAFCSTTFAADAATAFFVKGQSRVKSGDSYNLLAVGSGIVDGSFIKVGPKGALGVKTIDGCTVFFGENTSFRIRCITNLGSGRVEFVLHSGAVSGDFGAGANGSIVIRTASGTVDANNFTGQIVFKPARAGGGALSVASASGSPRVTPIGETVAMAVPAGYVFVNSGGLCAMTETQLRDVNDAVIGKTTAPSVNPTAPTGKR
jgi:hypothetical protein